MSVIWRCVATGPEATLPGGADLPMRNAVREAFRLVTGNEPTEISSGWGPPASIDGAWATLETLLPEGWWLASLELDGRTVHESSGRMHRISWWAAQAKGPRDAEQWGTDETPSGALANLAAKF